MRKFAALAAIALMVLPTLRAHGESREDGVLFIETVPLRAIALLDDEALDGETPLLVRGVQPGPHVLTVSKQGYQEQTVEFDVAPGETTVLSVDLARNDIDIVFPAEGTVVLNGEQANAQRSFVRAAPGHYRISREEGQVNIDPQFPLQSLIDGLTVAIPVFLCFATYLTIDAIVNPPSSGVVPAAVVVAHLSSLVLIGADITLNIIRSDYLSSFPSEVLDRDQLESSVEAVYAAGEERLSTGDMEQALTYYQTITGGFPESAFFPPALYRQAWIHYLLGNDRLAEQEFSHLIEQYAHADLYDKSQKNLADILLARGAYDEAIRHLEDMVFVDPLYTREDVDLLRCDILARQYREKPEVILRLIESYESMVQRYPLSDNAGLYRYRLANYLELAGRRDEAARHLRLIGTDSLSADLKQKVSDLLDKIGSGAGQ